MKRTVIFKKSIFVAFVLAVFSLPIFALEVPAWTGPVNDLAQVMTAQQRQELSDYLTNLNNQTGIQMAVLTVPSLEGDSIEDFSFRTASAWKLGQENALPKADRIAPPPAQRLPWHRLCPSLQPNPRQSGSTKQDQS